MNQLSYIPATNNPWTNYLKQLEKVAPYLSHSIDQLETALLHKPSL